VPEEVVMSDDGDALPEVGPWAKEKLERLGKYLAAYTTVMKEQAHWCRGYVYIDAFAGSGRATVRETGPDDEHQVGMELIREPEEREVIDGSPAVALGIEHPFTAYRFVERDPERIEALRRLDAEYGVTRNIRIHEGDCNTALREMLIDNAKVNWREWRAVVFLDPFGMQVPWATIEGLARTRGVEVFLNFPVGMAIQRLLKRNAALSPSIRTRLDAYFGDPSWFDAVYRADPGLFGDDQVAKVEGSGKALLTWYLGRLKAAFGHASPAYLVRNSHGGHLYYLIHAGPNATGATIASHILGGGVRVKA
jgi:three-Cys-motif partner protein